MGRQAGKKATSLGNGRSQAWLCGDHPVNRVAGGVVRGLKTRPDHHGVLQHGDPQHMHVRVCKENQPAQGTALEWLYC